MYNGTCSTSSSKWEHAFEWEWKQEDAGGNERKGGSGGWSTLGQGLLPPTARSCARAAALRLPALLHLSEPLQSHFRGIIGWHFLHAPFWNSSLLFWLTQPTEILTRRKKACQYFPSDLTPLLNYKYCHFPFESGISLVPNIMHKRFLIKWSGLKHTFIKRLNSTIFTSINNTPGYN